MNTALLYLLMTPALAIPLDDGAAVELRYSGTLEATGRDATGAPVKRFSYFGLLKKTDIGGHDLSFVIEERGGSGWAWPERFGNIRFDRTGFARRRSQNQNSARTQRNVISAPNAATTL